MFLKKYKVKTSTAIKGSERKKLRSLVEIQFPALSSEDLNHLLSSRNELTQTKALVHNGAVVMIYYAGNVPYFFAVENRVFPTVYCLWRFPYLLPSIPTVPFVLEKLCNGADLMAPGVVVDEITFEDIQCLKPNDLCSIRIEGNLAAIAVGTAFMSGSDIVAEGRKGKAVLIMHCYKDNLWSSGDQTVLPIISVPLANYANVCLDNQDEINENVQAISPAEDDVSKIETDLAGLDICDLENAEVLVNENDIAITPTIEYHMDDILRQCFLLALKANGKKIQLPILTSSFYRTYVMTCCPATLNLDIKKSTFKKLSVFLKSLSESGMIKVKELTKGVESIIEIDIGHETLKTFVPDFIFREHRKQQKAEIVDETPQVQDNYKFPEIIEMFVVSAQVKLIFEGTKYRKGDALTASQVRDFLRGYVKSNAMQDAENPRSVVLDPVLSHALLKSSDRRTHMNWEEMFEVCTKHMSPAFSMAFDGEEPKLRKGHLEPIDVSIATRSGNKKVTLINNLENFGIKPETLASHVQVAVAASTSVGQAAAAKGKQVLIQGNQLRYLQTLFSETYKVPKKYLRGLDNISSKKKK